MSSNSSRRSSAHEEEDQSSLFFDDVDFWRAGGYGSTGDEYYEDEEGRYYSQDEGRGRRLRKKQRSQRSQRSRRGARSASSRGFGGGTSDIMSELSVGDIAMVEAGILRRELSTSTKKERGGSGSRNRRSRGIMREHSDNSIGSRGHRRRGLKTTLSLPPTLPEVWRMSSGFLSTMSFASLHNIYNSLSMNNGTFQSANAIQERRRRQQQQDEEAEEEEDAELRSKEIGTMGAAGGGSHRSQHQRRTSNTWIDDDAIHGPAVHVGAITSNAGGKGKGKGKKSSGILASSGGSRKGSWRRNFRESWPLRTMISPTLPKLSSPWGSPFGSPLFGSPKASGTGGGATSESSTMKSTIPGTLDSSRYRTDDVVSGFRFPNQPTLAPPYHSDNRSEVSGYSPPRQLPKPPRQALLAASVESAGDSPLGNGFYRGSNWTTGGRAMANMAPSRSGSGRSIRSVGTVERGMNSNYYKFEEMDTPVGLANPYHQPVAVAGGGGGSSSGISGMGIALSTPRESAVPAPLRLSSADSTLSGILRDTEKRLQDGTVTGVVARRNQRVSMSPSKRNLGVPSSGLLRPGSATAFSSAGGSGNEHIATLMITSAGGVHHAPPPAAPSSPAPSPTRGPPHSRMSGNFRQDSQASVLSEADSLLAEPSPVVDHFHALSSPVKHGGMGVGPSGPPPQQPVPPLPLARHNSFHGSISSSGSSLPTIYSVDENADADETHITVFGSSTSEGLNRLAGFVSPQTSSNTLDDPFVVIGAAATTSTKASPAPTATVANSERRSFGGQPSSGRSVPDFSQGPRLYGGPVSRNEALLRSDSPLGAISGNWSKSVEAQARRSEPSSRSESRIPRAQTPRAQTPQSQSQHNAVLLAAPRSAFGTMSGERRREERKTIRQVNDDEEHENVIAHSSTIPNILLTTPIERTNSPLPNKHMDELRAQASSPTLGRSREGNPELIASSPTISQLAGVIDYYLETSSSDQHNLSPHNRAGGAGRTVSEKSSSADLAGDSEFERNKNKALDELNKLIRGDGGDDSRGRPMSTPAMGTTGTASSVRLVPPEWLSNHEVGNQEASQGSRPGQRQAPNQKHQSMIPVSSTVAQLRRMNSQISSFSNAASGYSDGSSSGPYLPILMEGNPIVSPPRSRRDSARNYLAVGGAPIVGPGTAERGGRPTTERRKSHSGVNDEENRTHEASSWRPAPGPRPRSQGSKIPRLGDRAPETPKKKKRPMGHERHSIGHVGAGRTSEDSLGLYDADGFWIASSSPEKKKG